MEFRVLTWDDMPQIVKWRNACSETLRTPYLLNEDMQRQWYDTVICDRKSTTRYWGIWKKNNLIGYGGIENIEWENQTGEISLLISSEYREKGYGREAVKQILHRAFNQLNLHTVHGECYKCAPWLFWEKMIQEWEGYTHMVWLPFRKYWAGKYHDSLYFVFGRPYDEEKKAQ